MSRWSDLLELEDDGSPGRVCCLPDLFLDHLVPLPEPRTFLDEAADVAGRGGGNIATGAQTVELGGNAANLALALARLGVDVDLVAPTDGEGLRRAREVLEGAGGDVAGVRDVGRASRTVALEMDGEGSGGANVMLSDPGPLRGFGPGDLVEADRDRIRGADVAAVTNWAKTRPGGTALLEAVAGWAREGGTAVYLDTSDPATRPREEVHDLLAPEGPLEGVDVWGMNEHEARAFGRAAGLDEPDVDEAAEVLAGRVGGRVDVHTAEEALTRGSGGGRRVPAFDVDAARRTGAGDAWNAGNILADLLGSPDGERLRVAHAVAALAVRDGEPPTREPVAAFLEDRLG